MISMIYSSMSLTVSSTSFNLVVRASIFHFISVMTLLTSAWLDLSSIISELRDSPMSFVPFSAPDCYLHKDCSEFQLQRLTSWLIKSMAGSITSGSFFACEFLLLVVLFREERRKEREWGGGGEEKKNINQPKQQYFYPQLPRLQETILVHADLSLASAWDPKLQVWKSLVIWVYPLLFQVGRLQACPAPSSPQKSSHSAHTEVRVHYNTQQKPAARVSAAEAWICVADSKAVSRLVAIYSILCSVPS